jgi:hypothetical protein
LNLSISMRRPVFRRRDFHSGLCTELGNLISDVKGKGARLTSRDRNTDALLRLRPLHSSEEVDVMSMERRERPIAVELGQPATGRTRIFNGRPTGLLAMG